MCHCLRIGMRIVGCGLIQKNFTTLCDWLCKWLWMLPTAADQWYWSFNSANVATAEVLHIRLNESVTHTPSTHHIHTAFPVFLSICLIHMLKMFSDSYSIHNAANYLSLIKQFIHCLQDFLLSHALFQYACHWFSITKNKPFLSYLYPVSTFLFIVFLLFSIVLHLSLSCIFHFTSDTFSGTIYHYHNDCVYIWICVCVLGMTKVEEKLKAGRVKRSEGSGFSEEPQRRHTPSQSSKKDPATTSSGEDLDPFFKRLNLPIKM